MAIMSPSFIPSVPFDRPVVFSLQAQLHIFMLQRVCTASLLVFGAEECPIAALIDVGPVLKKIIAQGWILVYNCLMQWRKA
jgi:hypothetical protein